jgi:hypothetical protein
MKNYIGGRGDPHDPCAALTPRSVEFARQGHVRYRATEARHGFLNRSACPCVLLSRLGLAGGVVRFGCGWDGP